MIERLQGACGGRGRALAVLAVVLLGLGLRLDYAIRAPNQPIDDSLGYGRIARSLYEDGTYSQGPAGRGLQPASNYTPGLPLLIAGVYEVRGAPDEEAARILLALLGALAVPFAFILGRRLGGPTAGLIAAVPMAIYPAVLEYQGMFTTEPLGAALLGATVLAFLRAGEGVGYRRWAIAGVALGAMAMVRPEYLIFIAVLPILGVLRLRAVLDLGNAVLRAALMAGVACLVLAPWTIHNIVVLDRFVPLSTGGGQALFEGSYIPAGPDPQQVMPTILAREPVLRRELRATHPGPLYLDQVVAALAQHEHPGEPVDQALGEMGRHAYSEALQNEPLRLAGFFAQKAWRVWTVSTRGVMNATLWRVFHLALILAALIGLIVGLARRNYDAVVFAVILLLITAIQMVFVASPRRTLVLLPLISALAGLGLTWIGAQARARLGGPTRPYSVADADPRQVAGPGTHPS